LSVPRDTGYYSSSTGERLFGWMVVVILIAMRLTKDERE
jgi:hypothetical protein